MKVFVVTWSNPDGAGLLGAFATRELAVRALEADGYVDLSAVDTEFDYGKRWLGPVGEDGLLDPAEFDESSDEGAEIFETELVGSQGALACAPAREGDRYTIPYGPGFPKKEG